MAPSADDPKLVDEAFFDACAPEWRACWDYREWTDDHDNTPPLTQPLAPLLRAA
jgi:hypothetical protein